MTRVWDIVEYLSIWLVYHKLSILVNPGSNATSCNSNTSANKMKMNIISGSSKESLSATKLVFYEGLHKTTG